MAGNLMEAPARIVGTEETSLWQGIEPSAPELAAKPNATARVGARPVQLNLSAEAFDKLSQLKEILGVSSKTEVVRLGLGVLAWIVEELSENHKILVERVPGDRVELAFPYLRINTKARVG